MPTLRRQETVPFTPTGEKAVSLPAVEGERMTRPKSLSPRETTLPTIRSEP